MNEGRYLHTYSSIYDFGQFMDARLYILKCMYINIMTLIRLFFAQVKHIRFAQSTLNIK